MSNKTIQDYFQAEMQLLNEATEHFASRHPHEAARLNVDGRGGRDPHIERLLEGSAYLQARIRQQIDLGVHYVSEALLRHLAPQYLAPRPSMTIVEFTSPQNRLVHKEWIPNGIKLCSPAVGDEQTVCEFRTMQPLTVYPMRIDSIESIRSHGCTCLEMSFKLNDGVAPSSLDVDELSFYIDASNLVAKQWYFNLTRHVSTILLKQNNGDELVIGDQRQMTGMHLHDFDTTVPSLFYHTKAFELLGDYFQFPERFWFVKLKPLKMPIQEDVFSIIINFSQALPHDRLSSALFKLHCVPASNVFLTSCEPIRYHKNRSDYPIIISQERPSSLCLLAMKRVVGVKKQSSEALELFDFHQSSSMTYPHGRYRLSQVQEKEERLNYHLTFSGTMPDEMSISCDVLAFNGHYPRQYLLAKTLFIKDDRVSIQIEASNLSKPSRCYHPVFDSQYAVQVLSCIHARFHRLADVQYLKQLLQLHAWSGNSSTLIEGIKDVQMNAFNRLCRGVILRGIHFDLTVADESFQSIPDLYFLGTVLHHFVRYLAPLNTVVETTLDVIPSGRALHWKI